MVSTQNLGSGRQRACRVKLRVVEYRVFAFFFLVTRHSRGLVTVSKDIVWIPTSSFSFLLCSQTTLLELLTLQRSFSLLTATSLTAFALLFSATNLAAFATADLCY